MSFQAVLPYRGPEVASKGGARGVFRAVPLATARRLRLSRSVPLSALVLVVGGGATAGVVCGEPPWDGSEVVAVRSRRAGGATRFGLDGSAAVEPEYRRLSPSSAFPGGKRWWSH
jgi:hypothetical protein